MDFDGVLEQIGEFGKYQIQNYLLICLPVFFGAANSLTYVFTAAVPKYRCLVPQCDVGDISYDSSWVTFAVPTSKISRTSTEFEPSQCLRFKYVENIVNNQTATEYCEPDAFTTEEIKCNQWIFDPNERSIVNDWLITCPENQKKLALVGTMHFAGIAAGTMAFGCLADRFGRKIIFIAAIILMAITGVAQVFASGLLEFYFYVFLNAIGTSGVYSLAFVLAVEMVGKSKREVASMALNYFYATGEAMVGAVAWLSRDWKILQTAASLPALIFMTYYWLLPESPRWLIARGRNSEAKLIIEKAARVNGKGLDQINLKSDLTSKDPNSVTEKKMWSTFKDFMRSKLMLIRAVILFYLWSANAFIYYGLSLSSVNLSGNKYLNFILVALIAIPGYTLAQQGMNKSGRKISSFVALITCGLMCFSGAFLNGVSTWISVSLYLIGKLSITASFGILYCYTSEMLPTIIRSGGCGMFSTSARFTALLAPFVPLLEHIEPYLPLTLFGLIAFIGGLLVLILPETLGSKLPETIQDAEGLGKKSQKTVIEKEIEITRL